MLPIKRTQTKIRACTVKPSNLFKQTIHYLEVSKKNVPWTK